MIEIKLKFESPAEAIAALSRLGVFAGQREPAMVMSAKTADDGTVKVSEALKGKSAIKAAAEALKTAGVAALVDGVAKVTAEPAKTEAPITYADVKAAVGKLTLIGAGTPEDSGRVAARAILKELGLTTFQGSPEELWPQAIAKVNAAAAQLRGS